MMREFLGFSANSNIPNYIDYSASVGFKNENNKLRVFNGGDVDGPWYSRGRVAGG